MKTDPNAPAFPGFTYDKQPGYEGTMLPEGGLTKREEFAARADLPWDAMIETLKNKGLKPEEITVQAVLDLRADLATIWADALIDALNREKA
jgi:hypothetical protein